jgi:hypothetical protein|tara:strand:- start:357 stop:587 length:231 start_codon:yes stop_codon:yes gene_type:complete
MGQSVYEGRSMNIEEEAAKFRNSYETFSEALTEAASNMGQYYNDNLYTSEERANAQERLTESIMWAKKAADLHGVK